MSNKAFQRALDCLAHPLALAAVAVLALNALVLQPRWPSWWTGKIGDVAWLFFVPLLVAALLSWLVPRRLAGQERIVGPAAVALTGLAFVLVKAVPAVNTLATTAFWQLTGQAAKLRLDPTDLLALPALLGAGLLWEKAPRRSAQPLLRGVVLLVVVAVTGADAAAPYSKGIICLLAFEEYWEADGKFSGGDNLHWHSYRSTDGGLSWQKDEGERQDNPCSRETVATWPVRDRPHRLEYTFVAGEGVYARRYDGPMAAHLSLPLPKGIAVTGVVFHEPTGNVVLALGPDQIMVKASDEPWEPRYPIPQTELLGKAILRPTPPPNPTQPTAMPRPTARLRPTSPPPQSPNWLDPTVAPRGIIQVNDRYYLSNLDTIAGVPFKVYTGDPALDSAPGVYRTVDFDTVVLDSPHSHAVAVVDDAGSVLHVYELWTVSVALYNPESRDLLARQVVVWREGQLIGGVGGVHFGEGGENYVIPAEKDKVFALLKRGQALRIQLTVGLSVEDYQHILSQRVTSPFPGTGVDQDLYFYGILLGADPERRLQGFGPCPTAEEWARWTNGTALPQASLLGIASNVKAIRK